MPPMIFFLHLMVPGVRAGFHPSDGRSSIQSPGSDPVAGRGNAPVALYRCCRWFGTYGSPWRFKQQRRYTPHPHPGQSPSITSEEQRERTGVPPKTQERMPRPAAAGPQLPRQLNGNTHIVAYVGGRGVVPPRKPSITDNIRHRHEPRRRRWPHSMYRCNLNRNGFTLSVACFKDQIGAGAGPQWNNIDVEAGEMASGSHRDHTRIADLHIYLFHWADTRSPAGPG